ncbi:MAG TPA: copper resistance protein CopC [Candidatus Xenobia bacterium]|jgi:hypothetical protein
MKTFHIIAASLLLAVPAFAHAHLKSSTPASGATVKAPAQVTLTFTEPVNAGSSTFKVYPQPKGTLNLAQLLNAKNDQAKRVDKGISPTQGGVSTVTIDLQAGLKPGTYVVMWKVLAEDDGHVTQDDLIFTVKR